MTSALRALISTLALFLAFASPVTAQETDAESAARYFARLDQNKDGGFTLADMQRIETKSFQRTDDDTDGVLSFDEFIFGIPEDRQDVIDRFTRRFELADADQDGDLTLEEYMQFCATVVQTADTNADGVVTKDEFLAANIASE